MTLKILLLSLYLVPMLYCLTLARFPHWFGFRVNDYRFREMDHDTIEVLLIGLFPVLNIFMVYFTLEVLFSRYSFNDNFITRFFKKIGIFVVRICCCENTKKNKQTEYCTFNPDEE